MSEIKPALSCDLHDGKITIISLQAFTLNVGPNYFYTAADVDRALAAAQRDAERYRWLRDNARYWEWQPDFTCYFGITVGFVYKSTGYCDYSLEAAIDDAMSQDKRQSALDRMAEDERKLGMALDQEERDE